MKRIAFGMRLKPGLMALCALTGIISAWAQDVALEQPPRAEAQDSFSVSAFGAKGDGTSDDGPAVQKALNAANAAGRGAEVMFEAGNRGLVLSAFSQQGIVLRDVRVTVEDGRQRSELIRTRNCSGIQEQDVSFSLGKEPK
jgi:hypothetical protein